VTTPPIPNVTPASVTATRRASDVQPEVPEKPAPAATTFDRRSRRGIINADTVATVAVAIAVGAAVFLVVAVLLGAGSAGPLITAAAITLSGFVVAFIAMALERPHP
jgi:hypothetical protein